MNRRILKDAIRQVREARAEAAAEGEELTEFVGGKKKIEYLTDTLELKNAGVERRRTQRNEQVALRRAAVEAKRQKIKDENITTEWYFPAGELVVVKSGGRSYYGKPPAGTIAMIVDTVDRKDYNGQLISGAQITVMVNGQIETWPAEWVKHCE